MRPRSQNKNYLNGYSLNLYSSIIAFAAMVLLPLSATTLQAQVKIADLIQQARSSFQPVSEQDVAAARATLRQHIAEVGDFVNPASENGQQWFRYLRFDALKQAVATDKPTDLAPLNTTLRQINRDETGLENRRFRNLAQSLQRYRDLVAVSSWDKPAEIYGKQLDALQRDLEAYRKEPSPRAQAILSDRLRIIDGIGQAPKLVAAIRADLAKPNAFVDISTDFVAASAGAIDRCEPVRDCILGTDVHSNAHTTGHVHVVSIPSPDRAIVEFQSNGHVFSNNKGFNGPAVIRSTSDTNFTARKRVELSDNAFFSMPATSSANTDIHLGSVSKKGGGLGSRLVSNIGWKRAQESRGQAESIAASHAEDRIENKFDEELDDEVAKARQRYLDEYRRPLERRGEVPDHIRFSSAKNSIGFEVTQANSSQLGAPSAPPAASEEHDVTMRLHETAVNNYSASLVGGATARQTKPDEDVKFNVPLPQWMEKMWKNRKTEATTNGAGKDEPFKEYALTFRDNRPISVSFDNNKVSLTVHIAQLKSGDKTFENWDVTSTYLPELVDGKVILRREGDLVMLPADFRGQLNNRQVGERRNLEEELNKRSDQGRGFPKTIQFDPITPEGKIAEAGPLEFRFFSTAGGWLTIGLDRQSKPRPVASKVALSR